jgi:CubicO group peptidase (beta-lactamase class C family)
MRTRRRLILASVLLSLLTMSGGRQLAAQNAASTATKLDQYLSALTSAQRFSGAVLVARDGQIVLSRGYGMANYEWDVPNTPSTKFRLGSITKQFTSMAIMQLGEKGLLSVDDSITRHLADYPKTGDRITIHHLLTHSSGIPSYTGVPEYQKNMRVAFSPAQMIDGFKDKPLEFAPGEKFKYDNSGYFLLGAIIEKVSGQPYDQYLQTHIFDPLGMKDSGYDRPQTLLKQRAAGYEWSASGLRNTEYLDMGQPFAAGSLYSTVEDLYSWDQALYTEKLVKRATLDQIFTPRIESAPGVQYAYGWSVSTVHERKMIGHGGGINGFSTFIARFPDERAVVIVLRNVLRPGGPAVQNDLAAILFGEPLTSGPPHP